MDKKAPGPRETATILGGRLRELRKARAMTLQALADKAGLSVGFLSQLERNQASPSVRALNALAQALDVSIHWFFPDPEEEQDPDADIIVRSGRRRAIRFDTGIKDELLCPTLTGQLEMLLCTLQPGASSDDELYSHKGEEAGYVASGTLELTVEEKTYYLAAGDSFHFNSNRPHRYRNPGSEVTTVIWAMTPPHY
ncbi:MAG: XRE family transcriptional regulator [Pseudomonadota bacterium]